VTGNVPGYCARSRGSKYENEIAAWKVRSTFYPLRGVQRKGG
jgi:hypothetical protein